ncbi:Beta-hexosaminidase 2 [Apostasia shenzhenica]|uniref:Beta-hexosaminidase n=1 Tax=Apostasia shenzhenica TaxID=1088818 RepID=A0A2I0APD8_9ASPA|nr:Beta-hexosaminidase 2 [Apostasia shenzhenica]
MACSTPPFLSPPPLLFLLFPLILFSPLISSNPLPIALWPMPAAVSWPDPAAVPLSPNFRILLPRPHHRHLRAAAHRYRGLILSERHRPFVSPAVPLSSVPLLSLSLSVSNPSAPLRHGVSESYTLSVNSSAGAAVSAFLAADTVWGAIRGLETFSQLAWGDPPVVASGITITDRPLFPHRGLMLDTSRNYYPVEDLKRTVAAMAANKMNVFHWHITDSHSFPIMLPSVPELAEKGAYSPAMTYSPDEVRELVEFGLSHGVRILPEIDAPGHTGSWAAAHPDIVTCANMFWLPNGTGDWAGRLAAEPGTGQLNPLHPKTYDLHRRVIADVASLFPDPFLHAGADEVAPACWATDPSVRSFLAAGGTLDNLLDTFINSTHPFIVSLNRTAVYWEDVVLGPDVKLSSPAILPPATAILQTWNNGPNNTKRIVSAGYRAIVSSSDFYYLDCGHGDFVGNDSRYDGPAAADGDGGSWCGPFKTWQRIYDYDITEGLEGEEAGRVMGGEVALWSEQADREVLDGRVWPRAAAMAEAMWSGNRDEKGRRRSAEAADRLSEWRDRMVGRGIRAEPIQPLWCRKHPGMCNLNE